MSYRPTIDVFVFPNGRDALAAARSFAAAEQLDLHVNQRFVVHGPKRRTYFATVEELAEKFGGTRAQSVTFDETCDSYPNAEVLASAKAKAEAIRIRGKADG